MELYNFLCPGIKLGMWLIEKKILIINKFIFIGIFQIYNI